MAFALTLTKAGILSTVVSSTAQPGNWRTRLSGTTCLDGDIEVVSRDMISEIDPPSLIVMARPASFHIEDLRLVSGAWSVTSPPTYTAANGLLPVETGDRSGRFVLNAGISGTLDPVTKASCVSIKAVHASFIDEMGVGRELARIFSRVAGLTVRAVDGAQLQHELHKKVVLNSVANGLGAITGMGMRALGESAPLAEGVDGLWREGARVLALVEESPTACRDWLIEGGDHLPSTARAILEGRASDIGFLNGAIVDRAGLQKQEARINRLVATLAKSGVQLTADDLGACLNVVLN
ncbi:MAG: hypothetical protein NT154_06790 [Verrucomicrobia bacterium]|nr:hypothetical protein [Verrucomicrobiota bacterium]